MAERTNESASVPLNRLVALHESLGSSTSYKMTESERSDEWEKIRRAYVLFDVELNDKLKKSSSASSVCEKIMSFCKARTS
jgi:hypothetical protein